MANNNYHDLVDRKEIADSVEWWNGMGKNNFPDHEFVGKTVDEAIEYWKAQAKNTEELERILKLYEENSDLLASDEDFVMVRELLTHPEKDRLRLIHDGSYYTHRIWFNINNDGLIKVSPSIRWKDDEFECMDQKLDEILSPREKIDFLFENFEVVYVQTPMFESREKLESSIHWEMKNREFSRFVWNDIY